MKRCALLAFTLLLGGRPAGAGVLLSDDAETGTVLKTQSPPGPWPDLQVSGNATITDVTSAAHRGVNGLRVNDNEGGSGQDSTATVDAPVPAGATQLFVRTWMRYSALARGNDIFFIDFEGRSGGQLKDMLSLSFGAAGASPDPLYARGWAKDQGALTYLEDPVVPDFSADAWHLLELGLTGIGTAATHRKIWVDGVAVNDRTADTTGFVPEQLVLGEGFGDTSFQGNLDFDDVRLSDGPPASTLGLEGPSTLTAGVCVPLTVTLKDSDGNPAAAPYDVVLALGTGAGAELWNAACDAAAETVSLATGQSKVLLGIRASRAGADSLRAMQIDFRSTPFAVTVQPGSGAGARSSSPWALDFGCSAVNGDGPMGTGSLLLLAALWRRRTCKAR